MQGTATALALLVVLGLFGVVLARYYVPAYFYGIDESGYLVPARLLAVHGSPAKYATDPYEFAGENMVEPRENVYYPKYPLGYPLLGAAAYKIGGPAAPFLVNPILALLGIVGIFLLGRSLLGRCGGLLAAAILASNPLYVYYALRPMSHAGAVCFATWGLYLLWTWWTGGRPWRAALAGALIAYTLSVRSAEGLLLLVPLALLTWRVIDVWRAPRCAPPRARWRAALRPAWPLLAGVAVGLLPQLVYQWQAFGAPWITGYTLCGEDSGFSLAGFKARLPLMLRTLSLPAYGLGLVFPLGLVGLALLLVRNRPKALLLGLWSLPILIVYTAYYFYLDDKPLGRVLWVRFFLTAYPPLIVSALALLLHATPWRRTGLFLATLMTLASLTWNVRSEGMRKELISLRNGQSFSLGIGTMVHATLPPGSAIIGAGWTPYFIDYMGDYHVYYPNDWNLTTIKNRVKEADSPGGVHGFQIQRAQKTKRLYGGKSATQIDEIVRDIVREHLAKGRIVAVVCSRGEQAGWQRRLGPAFALRQRGQPTGDWAVYEVGSDR